MSSSIQPKMFSRTQGNPANNHTNPNEDDLVFYGLSLQNDRTQQHVILSKDWRTFEEYRYFVFSLYPDVDEQLLHKLWRNCHSWIASVDIIKSLLHCKLRSVDITVDNFSTFDVLSHNWPPIIRISTTIALNSFSRAISETNSVGDDKSSMNDSWSLVDDPTALEWEFLSFTDIHHDTNENEPFLDFGKGFTATEEVKPAIIPKLSYKDALIVKMKDAPDACERERTVQKKKYQHAHLHAVLLVVSIPRRRANVEYGNIVQGKLCLFYFSMDLSW